ncbi:MAG: hypothetical protein IT293_10930 [Deltaproteobacteria bacterium]|nr:hypothetical protein [Deltaproteobacteria bacterium]
MRGRARPTAVRIGVWTRSLVAIATVAAGLAAPLRAHAALAAGDTTWDGSEPPTGIYFHWYEPSFYAGFAPRTQDPSRVHIELARGNQVRVTVVLGDAELAAYLGDLQERRAVVQELVDRKILTLSTNREWERFTKALDDAGVGAALGARASTSPEAWRAKSLAVMKTLNPERVFSITMPLAGVAARWRPVVAAIDGTDPAQRLDAANAVLPGRIVLEQLPPPVDSALGRCIDPARGGKDLVPAFELCVKNFVELASGSHYRVPNDAVVADEFTAIYPAGTVEGTTTYKGEKLPDFGVTGVWPLIRRTHGRGILGMVDYLSPNPGYGYIVMLPYQYAGGITYNAFHNAGVRCQLNSTPFLPSAWRKVAGERSGKPYENLWIVGRGPTSHGCTRLPSGHMSELRQIVPSESDTLLRVQTHRNLPGCYDAFDIDGDGAPEVMGVQYYLAYRSNEHTPVKAWVSNRREPFYRWLYGDNVVLGAVGATRLKDVPVCRFVGRKASERTVLHDLPLHEAPYQPEQIQFFRAKVAPESTPGFELNRELRKVGAGHTLDRSRLLLQ